MKTVLLSALISALFSGLFCSFSPQMILPFAIQQAPGGDCAMVNLPVCGMNGKTYQNICFMYKGGVAKAYDGWCKPDDNVKKLRAAAEAAGAPSLVDFTKNADNGFLGPTEPFTDCPCNNNLNPVCGSNGVSYANYCRADCKNVTPVHYGQCGALYSNFKQGMICDCAFNFQQICATNGITYENQCVAKCFNAMVNFTGICAQPCGCAFFFKPVCGVNGKNYVNNCALDCAQVNKYNDGLCADNSTCSKCYGTVERVCGKDGKTYDNNCYLECAGVPKSYDGYCVEGADLFDYNLRQGSQDNRVCNCPMTYLPVCGINNITYINECELNCAGVKKASNRACGDNVDVESACRKNSKRLGYNPVCGTDTLTYYNRSMIDCDEGVSVLYKGECKPIYYEWCKGTRELKAVCGVDGRTYLNESILTCVGVAKYADGTCELGVNGWVTGSNQKGQNNLMAANNTNQNLKAGKYDEKINSQWYNTIWGNTTNQWACDKYKRVSDACQPVVDVKYILVAKPVHQKAIIVVFLPVCKNIRRFKNLYDRNNFQGFKGFIPDKDFLVRYLLNSYEGDNKQNIKIEDILDIVFGGQTQQDVSESDSLRINFEVNTLIQNDNDIKNKAMGMNFVKIPEAHKIQMKENPTLYYLFFYLMLFNNVITPETKITDEYCVRDALFFILQLVWQLDVAAVNVPNGNMDNLSAALNQSSNNRANANVPFNFKQNFDNQYINQRIIGSGV